MNKQNIPIIIISLLFITASCSVRRHLLPGTQLYKGATYLIEKEKGNKVSAKLIKSQLKEITSPVANKTILGYPYRVAFWYWVGEPKKQSGFKYWLRNKLGEAPVLSTAVNAKANAVNFHVYLENKGYFNTGVSGDTVVKGYKVTAKYKVELGMPYKINTVSWIKDSVSLIGKDISAIPPKESYVKNKEQYDLDNIKAERSRTDIFLKSRGYYYFSPDHIKAWVDSGKGDHQVNIYFKLKDEIPLSATLPQTIRQITLFPNYTLITPPPDTSKTGMIFVDSIYIRDTVNDLTSTTLIRPVSYRPGSLYSIRQQNKTLNRFINLGVFKFVKNRFEGDRDTVTPHFLNVYYYLTPLPKKTLQAEIGTFTKSNSFTGALASFTWRNRNAFKGAEQLYFKGYGAFETSGADSLRANNNFRLGGEASLIFPRFYTPFKIKDNNFFPPKTKFTVGYEWFRRQALYTKNFFRLQYDITWKNTANVEYTLAPISVTYNTTNAFSSQYLALVNTVPALQISNLPELIMGSYYNYTFHTLNHNAINIFYFNGNIDVAGNTAGLFVKPSRPYTAKIGGAYFAQYVKLEADLRYSKKLDKETYWANRIIIGAGSPYGNSSFLPFSRQFIIGGSNSIRGFLPRQLGPGRAKASALQQLYYPQVGGDYKLEMNTELRFPMFSSVKGAVFIDAGNIWTKDTVLYGKAAQFNSSFMNDIAVSAGFGFRIDIGVLIIRLDIAAPLRVPYLQSGREWVISDINLFKSAWRRENLVYNIGIGYPF